MSYASFAEAVDARVADLFAAPEHQKAASDAARLLEAALTANDFSLTAFVPQEDAMGVQALFDYAGYPFRVTLTRALSLIDPAQRPYVMVESFDGMGMEAARLIGDGITPEDADDFVNEAVAKADEAISRHEDPYTDIFTDPESERSLLNPQNPYMKFFR